jgi:hypothetical protein
MVKLGLYLYLGKIQRMKMRGLGSQRNRALIAVPVIASSLIFGKIAPLVGADEIKAPRQEVVAPAQAQTVQRAEITGPVWGITIGLGMALAGGFFFEYLPSKIAKKRHEARDRKDASKPSS